MKRANERNGMFKCAIMYCKVCYMYIIGKEEERM